MSSAPAILDVVDGDKVRWKVQNETGAWAQPRPQKQDQTRSWSLQPLQTEVPILEIIKSV